MMRSAASPASDVLVGRARGFVRGLDLCLDLRPRWRSWNQGGLTPPPLDLYLPPLVDAFCARMLAHLNEISKRGLGIGGALLREWRRAAWEFGATSPGEGVGVRPYLDDSRWVADRTSSDGGFRTICPREGVETA